LRNFAVTILECPLLCPNRSNFANILRTNIQLSSRTKEKWMAGAPRTQSFSLRPNPYDRAEPAPSRHSSRIFDRALTLSILRNSLPLRYFHYRAPDHFDTSSVNKGPLCELRLKETGNRKRTQHRDLNFKFCDGIEKLNQIKVS